MIQRFQHETHKATGTALYDGSLLAYRTRFLVKGWISCRGDLCRVHTGGLCR